MNNKEKNEFLHQEMYNTPGNIVSIGFGWKRTNGKLVSDNAIVYGVTEKKPLDQIPQNQRIPSSKTVNGEVFITDVVQMNIKKANCSSWAQWLTTPPSNQNEFRPLKGGISVTNFTQMNNGTGTLGFIAIDNEDRNLVGITNHHVVVPDAFYTSERNLAVGKLFENTSGSVATQPNESGSSDISYRIGLVKKYVPIFESASLADVKGINTVDAAAISIDPVARTSGLIDTAESWKQEGFTQLTSAPRFATEEEIDAALADPNTAYYSSGRTTGMKPPTTDDRLLRYEATAIITVGDYQKQGVNTPAIVENVFSLYAWNKSLGPDQICYFPIEKGDSGSAVFAYVIDKLTNQPELKIVGLVFAGYQAEEIVGNPTLIAYACRIDEVAKELNISVWDGKSINTKYATNTNLDTRVVSGSSDARFIQVGSEVYWQVGLVNNATNPPNYYP